MRDDRLWNEEHCKDAAEREEGEDFHDMIGPVVLLRAQSTLEPGSRQPFLPLLRCHVWSCGNGLDKLYHGLYVKS